jgi:transposase InsO family protein
MVVLIWQQYKTVTLRYIGYKFGREMTIGLIFHTDLGPQYTSEIFDEHLKKYEMIASFSRTSMRLKVLFILTAYRDLEHSKNGRYTEKLT